MNLTNTKAFVVPIAAIALCAVGFVTARSITAQSFKNTRKPITVTYTIYDANNQPNTYQTLAYRSDGSKVLINQLIGDPASAPVEIVDLALKKAFIKDPLTKTVAIQPFENRMQTKLTDIPVTCEAAFGPSAQCAAPSGESFAGYPVQEVRTTSGADTSLTIQWAAPALDFTPLRIQGFRKGSLRGRYEATSVTVGEPDPDWFVVPSDYRLVELSELINAAERVRGRVGLSQEQIQKRQSLGL